MICFADDRKSQLLSLEMATRRRRRQVFAVGTKKIMFHNVKLFKFFVIFSIGLVKSSVNTACLYNEFLCRSLRSPHTVKQYVPGIKLLALFAFLRQSNLVPSSKYKRNKNKHLCRSDICEVENGLASGRSG